MYRFELSDIHMEDLSRAIEIAKLAHKDQLDKAGKPYVNGKIKWMNFGQYKGMMFSSYR